MHIYSQSFSYFHVHSLTPTHTLNTRTGQTKLKWINVVVYGISCSYVHHYRFGFHKIYKTYNFLLLGRWYGRWYLLLRVVPLFPLVYQKLLSALPKHPNIRIRSLRKSVSLSQIPALFQFVEQTVLMHGIL
jgi:hypothetical protein